LAGPTPFAAEDFIRAGQTLLQNFFGAMTGQLGAPPKPSGTLGEAFGKSAAKLAALQTEFSKRHLSLWQSALAGDGERAARSERADRRFAASEWRTNPWFDYVRRSYEINARYLSDCVEAIDAEPLAKERLRFAARQMIDALSPANFVATNPEAIKLALETRGESLTHGVLNLIEDAHKGRISTTDEKVFEVGRNLAATEGSVVYENELMQLIQYAPETPTVYERPLVMIPPCINKFYILDLQPENSLVRHAVGQGHTVYMVSWRNVGAEQGHYGWDDYLEQGVLRAIDVARDVGAVEAVNALGFCVGGTMLGAALAVHAARGEHKVESATYLASMLDFSDTGDIGLFIDEASLAVREAAIGKGGIMPGRELAFVFSALRANDLVWSYVVNNYLKGRPPEAFDLLYWNADSTNLPGPMYCEYVRRTYLENALREPGRVSMLGVPIDLGKAQRPSYLLATREDHIVPWRTAYRSTGLLGGELRFVLGASGHVAGIINPAAKNRRSHWIGGDLPPDPDTWFQNAVEHRGSWWTDWSTWLSAFGGRRVKARRTLGNSRHRPIEPAPGRYAKHRIV
jgi:poly[(R)-3-hydroxyalkanoate] polymerase subunit PhaC